MKQSIYAEEYVGRQMFVLPPQKRVGIDIALVSRLLEPIVTHFLIVVHALAHEMHLAQHVLRILVSVLRRTAKPPGGCCVALGYMIAFVVLLSQTVGGVVISILRGDLQPVHSTFRIMYVDIIREVQLSQRMLCIHVVLLCRL